MNKSTFGMVSTISLLSLVTSFYVGTKGTPIMDFGTGLLAGLAVVGSVYVLWNFKKLKNVSTK